MNNLIDVTTIQSTREQVRSALADASDDNSRAALQASLDILDALLETSGANDAPSDSGSIDYTFEDEDYEPYGRQIEVRIRYTWHDYDCADEPFPVWGPTVEDVHVLAVRHFDANGDEVPGTEHHTDLAWELVNQHHEQIIEACTDDGYRTGAGKAPSTFAPRRSSPDTASSPPPDFAPRMAPSAPTRPTQRNRRQLG